MPVKRIECELFIIGSGLAGLTAALFAVNKGIRTARAGMPGELTFAGGMIDLLGVLPGSEGSVNEKPHEGLDILRKSFQEHPYSKIPVETIDTAIKDFCDFMTERGLRYHVEPGRNRMMLTGIGTLKPSYCIPDTMMPGVRAYEAKTPCLIIDIKGMKGFSARQIAETVKGRWPDVRHASVTFPDTRGEVFGESLAFSIEKRNILERFADEIRPHLDNSRVVGLPAILGNLRHAEVKADIEELLGLPVFEIPCLPPSVPGIRMKTVLENFLEEKGVARIGRRHVTGFEKTSDNRLLFRTDSTNSESEMVVEAEAAILATGRFLGKGLNADYSEISEPVFNLPVYQPESREFWHSRDFFDKKGHAVNRAGIITDNYFRPVGSDGEPFMENLFAAGSILAHNDWKRLKCGGGSALATAFAAVDAYEKTRKK